MPYKPIKSHEDIDISRHAIVEASAGTGKTYTIENLVVKFLKERDDLNLENILLVTFTEKATCELKLRIRKKLETQLDNFSSTSDSDKIKNALDTFDSASIYTIHGFCRSVLRDYAFENNAPFQWEVVDDYPLFERLLKEQIRKTWPAEFGDDLSEMLIISGFPREKNKFELSVIKAAMSFRQNTNDVIQPDVSRLTCSDILNHLKMIRHVVGELKNLSSQMPFCRGFEELNGQKPQKNFLWEKIITPLGDFLSKMQSDKFSLYPLLDIIDRMEDKGVDYLRIKYLKKGGPNPEACPHWATVSQHLEKLYELYLSLKDALQAVTILQLQKDVLAEKQKNGRISFDDMLYYVQNAVCSPDGSNLMNILRKKYKVAFVDEFQDTDPVQWQIFRKIFLRGRDTESQNLLFLIGDPKQAIYAFRGADVYAYLDARREMERLESKGAANCYQLSTNWRSEPDLIHIFNQLFSSNEWFDPVKTSGDFGISYFPVDPPENDKRIFSLNTDRSQRGFLNIIDLSDAPSIKASKPLLAKFIAEEIIYLTRPDNVVYYDRKNHEFHPLSHGDFCVLVRSKNDMPFLEEQFNRLNIPYSYYKKPGLFSSHEAFCLSLILQAIDEPDNVTRLNKALLTPFFDFTPEDLHLVEALGPEHPVKRLLLQWQQWAITGKWSLLFQSLMENSGFLFRESIKPDWERKHTNYCQIIEHLQDRAYHQHLDFRGLMALLDGYRKGTLAVGEDADLHQIETEEQKVQIMTMHVAKGLEFPVVFIFGGLTQPSGLGNGFYVYHKIDGNPPRPVRIFDLSKSSLGKTAHLHESESEDKRLYYVALTRAKVKLYVPFFEFNKNFTWVGPVSKLISPALVKAFGSDKNYGRNVQWFNGSKSDFHKPLFDEPQHPVKSDMIAKQDIIASISKPFFPQPGHFSHRIIDMVSFSGLTRMTSEKKETDNLDFGFSTMPEPVIKDDEMFTSDRNESSEGPGVPNDIPGGTDTGSMFHDILENISFEAVIEAASKKNDHPHPLLGISTTKKLIESKMEFYQIDRRWISLVCDVILNTLTTPISYVSDSFILAQLKKSDRLHEAEFYFSYPSRADGYLPECKMCDGFVHGFIDLIFRYEDKFYIADWKSNILEEGYAKASLEKNMTQANYHLQYKIYTVAALRWLNKSLGERFDQKKNFGGVFYFYIRGMNPKSNNGIYYLPSNSLGTLETMENRMLHNFTGFGG